MKPTCLIIDLMHPSIIPLLEEMGMQVIYQPGIAAEEVKTALKGCEVLIVRSKLKITAEVLAEATTLKVIARAGAGVDNIDEEVLATRNIKLINAPEGNRNAVGEFTLGLLLNLFRKIAKADKEVREYIWLREPNRGEEVAGKTIGIIGYGNMGKAFARCLAGFDCKVLAYDIADTIFSDEFATAVSLTQLQQEADVVSFHIPYIPANYHFANNQFFENFRKPVWLLNTARGEVMDYSALIKGLQAGKILGAGLDVLENEKLSKLTPSQQENFEWLSRAENVILTPHIAGWSYQSYQKINKVLAMKLQTALF